MGGLVSLPWKKGFYSIEQVIPEEGSTASEINARWVSQDIILPQNNFPASSMNTSEHQSTPKNNFKFKHDVSVPKTTAVNDGNRNTPSAIDQSESPAVVRVKNNDPFSSDLQTGTTGKKGNKGKKSPASLPSYDEATRSGIDRAIDNKNQAMNTSKDFMETASNVSICSETLDTSDVNSEHDTITGVESRYKFSDDDSVNLEVVSPERAIIQNTEMDSDSQSEGPREEESIHEAYIG